MKQIVKINTADSSTHVALLIARIGIGLLMLTHGIPKLLMLFSVEPIKFPPVFGMSSELSLILAVFAEVLCSVFIIAGFITRIAAIPLIVTMISAAAVIHVNDPFARQEPAILYLLIYLVLLLAGSGKYSVDYLLRHKVPDAGSSGKGGNKSGLAIYQ